MQSKFVYFQQGFRFSAIPRLRYLILFATNIYTERLVKVQINLNMQIASLYCHALYGSPQCHIILQGHQFYSLLFCGFFRPELSFFPYLSW